MLPTKHRLRTAFAVIAITLAAAGVTAARFLEPLASQTLAAEADERKVLYWYDPMVPGQHSDQPGKSPFMDMELIPKYADEADEGAGIRIDPAKLQNLGLRLGAVRRGALSSNLVATGIVEFSERDVAVVQAWANGFVQKVYRRAPGDLIDAGAPLADVLIPDWAGAQSEFLAVKDTGNVPLTRAARQRLTLLGMPSGLIDEVERGGWTRTVFTLTSPAGGVIRSLGVRVGMAIAAGQILAEVNGIDTVWLNAAVPEALAAQVHEGDRVAASFAAFAGEKFAGRVAAVLPEAQSDSRTFRVRIELPNKDRRLRPGQFAAVQWNGSPRSALLVPSEALIHTGKRTLVMLALDGGRFQPAEVRIGTEAGAETEVLAGLSEGEAVVTSGQFLIDSEASLSGIVARPIDRIVSAASGARALHETVGTVEELEPDAVTVSHDPVPAIGWPAMTMVFRLENPALAVGVSQGDRVRFAFDQPPAGPTVRRMVKEAGP